MEDHTNTVFAEIEINATTEQVWSVLTDWKKLSEWSSSFVGISTDTMAKGDQFTVYFNNPLGGRIAFERTCTAYEEGRMFSWSGELSPHGCTDNHVFLLEATALGTTLFKQEDGIHGSYSQLMNFLSNRYMKSMYDQFNRQLKERVESLYPR